MKFIRIITESFAAISLLALASGCTHMQSVSVKLTALPAGPISAHHVVLVLDQPLADYKYEYNSMGDTFAYPYGIPLQGYARQIAGKCFQQVDVVPTVEQAEGLTTADLILIPRAVKCDRTIPVWAWEDINMTLVVEWMAKDRASQNTVWLKTITADASESGGNAFTMRKHGRILNQKLFDDLSLKTYNAIQEAPELK